MATDWAAEGLLDGLEGDERDSRVALLELLVGEGASLEEIRRSHAEGELLFLLAGRAIGLEVRYTWRDVVERSGLDEALVERLVRAQGMTRADDGQPWYTDADLGMLQRTREFLESGVTEEEIAVVGRLLGRGLGQAAEAMRGVAMRMVLEPGLDERELAIRYAHAAGALTPMVEPLLGNMLRLHLSKLVSTELISAEERQTGKVAGSRPVAVAFADLVGFTRLGETVPPDELGAVAARLEHLAVEVVEPPVRFVKTIGDAVMLVAPDSPSMLDGTLTLLDAAEAEGPAFPQLRAGVAAGEALGRAGDWFGHPVNLASRVTNIARPGSVLATEDVQVAAADGYRWSKAGIRPIKGIEAPVALWRARRLEPAAEPGA
jgi:adenylate cyclase